MTVSVNVSAWDTSSFVVGMTEKGIVIEGKTDEFIGSEERIFKGVCLLVNVTANGNDSEGTIVECVGSVAKLVKGCTVSVGTPAEVPVPVAISAGVVIVFVAGTAEDSVIVDRSAWDKGWR